LGFPEDGRVEQVLIRRLLTGSEEPLKVAARGRLIVLA